MVQIEDLALSFVAILIVVLAYLVLGGRIKSLQSKLEQTASSVNQWTNWIRTTDAGTLRQEFQKFGDA
jgi:hypothetical protein